MTEPSLPQQQRLKQVLENAATPRWLKELHQFLGVKSQFVLYGNIRDYHPSPEGENASAGYGLSATSELIVDLLALKGYRHFLLMSPLQGITILTPTDRDPRDARQTVSWLQKNVSLKRRFDVAEGDLRFEPVTADGPWRAAATFEESMAFAEALVHNRSEPCAMLFDYLMGHTERGATSDRAVFVRALMASYEARPLARHYNTLFWLCDRDNDLPAWYTFNNPNVRTLSVPKPDGRTRALIGEFLLGRVSGFEQLGKELQGRVVHEFAQQSDGLLIRDLQSIVRFLVERRQERTGEPASEDAVGEIAEAARRYKLGVTEDPWRRIGDDLNVVTRIEDVLRKRVKGQDHAVRKTLDIVRRAIIGLSGAQSGPMSGRPRGVLFLAGPTGVGKTELAKSLTEGLFGDETAYIRFDMSEFNLEHADQRLIGAPPGYVGFEAGGELTTAIRERPFAVVLFDEIEKAHDRVLDKFLQILDDGQLTSGKGERVYFSDAVIVFTSNLGMSTASAGDDYATLASKLREGIAKHFVEKLRRPELLNRIGDNIVVFDYIRPPVAERILAKMVHAVLERVQRTHGIAVTIGGFMEGTAPVPGSAYERLVQHCTADLSHGGRGVGNLLETAFVDPLSRALWERRRRGQHTSRVHVHRISTLAGETQVELVDA